MNPRHLALVSLLSAVALADIACVAPVESADEEGVGAEAEELRTSDLEIRGTIGADRCLHTAGTRSKKYIAFAFDAKAGQRFDITLTGYATPDLRILAADGRQLARGRKAFEGDGVDGGFLSELTFEAPATAKYLVALRDPDVAPGKRLPDWVRASVWMDATGTRARPTACPAVG